MGTNEQNNLLEVQNLHTHFHTDSGVVKAVDGISFSLQSGKVLGIVGESGCGKSIASMSLMRLIPSPPGKIFGDNVSFNGKNLLELSENQMRKIRGNEIAMIFQEPMTSLNPVYTIGNQLGEAIKLHQGVNKQYIEDKAIEVLNLVGIPRPKEILKEYPHSLSGGMRQRIMIAMAVSCNPSLLIADEPTTALDVTIQAQILELMKDLIKQLNTSIIFITHDLGVIAEMAEHVMVMYAGKVVEETDIFSLFHSPRHPYTIGLLNSKPQIDKEEDNLIPIKGTVPNPLNMPEGCSFHPRCDQVMEQCKRQPPQLTEISPGHKVSCWHFSSFTKNNEEVEF